MNPKLYNKTLDLVKRLHGDQVRKYTGEPYWTHCEAVAKLVQRHTGDPILTAAALCHDIIEDTECDSMPTLCEALEKVGWSGSEVFNIAYLVDRLTDEFTTTRYPNCNRAWRKRKEAERLIEARPEVQTIKYADIIDNATCIATHDPKFARVFLQETRMLIDGMKDGNPVLRRIAGQVWRGAARKVRSCSTPVHQSNEIENNGRDSAYRFCGTCDSADVPVVYGVRQDPCTEARSEPLRSRS